MSLQIKNLHISAGNIPIVKGVSLELKPGQVAAIMGPNGSGKSTLANTLMGHPKYKITAGKIILDGKDITGLTPNKRAKLGLFLSMQHPPEIPGVSVANFLRQAKNAISDTRPPLNPLLKRRGRARLLPFQGDGRVGSRQLNPIEFYQELTKKMSDLKIDKNFASRHIHTGFSGGEKKKMEILQLAILNPTYALLDETDSGLDVDALKIVAGGINNFKNKNKAILLITHYNRILKYVVPDVVYIMAGGKIVKQGGRGLAKEIERNGYNNLK